jgi:hypothetical protein
MFAVDSTPKMGANSLEIVWHDVISAGVELPHQANATAHSGHCRDERFGTALFLFRPESNKNGATSLGRAASPLTFSDFIILPFISPTDKRCLWWAKPKVSRPLKCIDVSMREQA